MNKINKKNKNIKVVSTSTSCLDNCFYDIGDIDLVRIRIYINKKEYIDGKTIETKDFYNILSKKNNLDIKTSQPPIGELVCYFNDIAKKGYQTAFVTTLSKKLSGSYNTICQVQKQLKDKINIIVYNTNTVCFSEGYFALEAKRLFDRGASIEKVTQHLDFIKKNNTIFFIVGNLKQLIRNGRLSKTKGFLGRLLRIKPILQVNDKGEIVLIEKRITIDKVFASILDKIKKYTANKKFLIHLLTAGYTPFKEKFKTLLKKEFNLKNIVEIPSTPSIGAHIGDNALGVGIIILKTY